MMQHRIQVYTDPETKRLIELAAFKRDVPVTSYCLEAITQKLEEDELLGKEHVEVVIKQHPKKKDDLFERMRILQEKIKADRGGKIIDNIDDIIRDMREERINAILGVR